MWEKACGKLPTSRLASVSYCSRQEPDVVAQPYEALGQRPGVVESTEQHEAVRKPECTHQERTLVGGKTVAGLGRVVSKHEPIGHELLCYRVDGAAHAVVVCGQESHKRHPQQSGVKLRGAVGP